MQFIQKRRQAMKLSGHALGLGQSREDRGGAGPRLPSRLEFALAAAIVCVTSTAMHAQGILSVTPARSVATTAGTGALGSSGNGAAATSATLADPSALAYDSSGNLYIAEAQNHMVREVSAAGVITAFAGTGIEGYGGDGAAATAAYLDTPTGVAVDIAGSVYIADSHNHRIRKVSGGVITTIAGTGTPGFAGDGAAAASALLWLPTAVAVDASGNVYIADTNNQRIRKITGTTITTIAGDGEELYAGDGAAATSAVLDSPTGVAVDASGNVYIADRHNQRIRTVALAGTISTLAGSGPASFAGGFSGDGASAAAATFAKPSGVSVDALGNVYIADTNNQRIRQINAGTLATVVGSASQGYGGDGGPATSAILNSPKASIADTFGNLTVADKLNQRLRAAMLPTLTFTNDGVGVLSAAQAVTLSNTGPATLTVASIAFNGAFTTATGGTCSAPPITLAPAAGCTQKVSFLPVTPGAATGSVLFGGAGVVPQNILLAGTGVQTATTVLLASNLASALVNQAITFTATVAPAGIGTPTGNVTFFDGATPLGAVALVAGSASITTTTLAIGTHSLTAVYAGDSNDIGSTSAALSQLVVDFGFSLGTGTPPNQEVEPGQIASYSFNLLPVGGVFVLPIALSATGLPPGATVTFTPPVTTLAASGASFTVAIQTADSGASLRHNGLPGFGYGDGTIALGLLMLPFSRSMRRKLRRMRPLTMRAALGTALALGLAAFASLGVLAGLTGCGAHSAYAPPGPQTYTINVFATATGAGGTVLLHSAAVTLTVQ